MLSRPLVLLGLVWSVGVAQAQAVVRPVDPAASAWQAELVASALTARAERQRLLIWREGVGSWMQAEAKRAVTVRDALGLLGPPTPASPASAGLGLVVSLPTVWPPEALNAALAVWPTAWSQAVAVGWLQAADAPAMTRWAAQAQAAVLRLSAFSEAAPAAADAGRQFGAWLEASQQTVLQLGELWAASTERSQRLAQQDQQAVRKLADLDRLIASLEPVRPAGASSAAHAGHTP